MYRFTLCVLIVAAVFTTGVFAEQEPSHGYLVASDGLQIHYMTQGKGVPVVLIHGYMGSAEGNWFLNGIAAALAKNHYVVAIDCRGHGDSGKPGDPEKYGDQMWKDVLELMDHLNIGKAHIHGYSMGGGITTQLLARYPERFITAIYGGSGIRETDEKYKAEMPKDKEGRDPEEADAIATITAFGSRSEESTKALQAVRESFGSRSSVPVDLTTITFPVMALNGELDSPIAKTHRMARELANFTNVILPGKSHLTAIMQGFMPQQYVDTLVEFINANDPK